MVIGQRLRLFAKARYKTQRAFAERLEMGESQLSDYIKGRIMPGVEVLERFAGAGGVARLAAARKGRNGRANPTDRREGW